MATDQILASCVQRGRTLEAEALVNGRDGEHVSAPGELGRPVCAIAKRPRPRVFGAFPPIRSVA